MAWSVYGEELLTGSDFSQKITPSESMFLKAVRTYVVIYGTPTFGTISLRVYSNQGGAPASLMATANTTWTLAQLTAQANALKEIYFEFDSPLFLGVDSYHLQLFVSGYTGTVSSHVAWVRNFPEATNSHTPTVEGIAEGPFRLALIGAPKK